MTRQTIARTCVAICVLLGSITPGYGQPCSSATPDIVGEWTDLLLAVSGPGTATTAGRSQGNQVASRSLAMMTAAVYDAVNAIDRGHAVYFADARFLAHQGDSVEAAAAQAAHDVAAGLYNRTAEVALFDATLAAHLCGIPEGLVKYNGVAIGQYVAGRILAWRASDGSASTVPYTIGTNPGDWQPTPPGFSPTPAAPQWPSVTPFALAFGSQFRPGPPPALTSADYTEAFEQVKSLGGNGTTTPSSRTPEQTEIALFWGGAGASNAAVTIWNQIASTVSASHDLGLVQKSRLFALLNVTIADAFIAGFDAKYAFQDGHGFWRPVTAIRAADADDNPSTVSDPAWTPLLVTPAHPSYVALHATQSAAAAEALAAFFGTDRVPFTATWAGVARSFQRFSSAAHEAGVSRVYGGIHWSFDVAIGWQVGRKVGRYIGAHFFLP